MKKKFFWIIGIAFILGCKTLTTIKPPATLPAEISSTFASATVPSTIIPPSTFIPPPIFIAPPTLTPTPTSTSLPPESTTVEQPASTSTNSSAPPVSATLTAAWIRQGPDQVYIPILLYHRIAVSPVNSRYYVSPEKFEAEMKLLRDWDYTTITLDMLIQSIQEGADLPARPLLVTFDDGHENIFSTAFPIMKKYGFTGVAYIVGNYMGAEGYMNAEQIQSLAAAGWEVGSHSMNHRDVTTLDTQQQIREIIDSRIYLEEELNLPVKSFAYPFGVSDEQAINLVSEAGYTSGMSLGYTHDQSAGNLLWLQRRDVQGTYDIKKFAYFLPWQGDPVFLPTDTPTATATPSRTPKPSITPIPSRTPKPSITPTPSRAPKPSKTPTKKATVTLR